MVPNAHRSDPLQQDRTIRGVPIPNEISRRMVPRERLGDLARDPLRGWVCRHAKRHPKSSSVAHNDKSIQNLECDRRLGDLEGALEQLTMNAWCAPKWVRAAHLANERAQLSRDLRSANTVARSPAPIRLKPTTVPANDRFL